MRVEDFVHIVDLDFYTGVPDSQLKALCDYLYAEYGTDAKHHIIAANEGNCVGIAAGYHMATGKIPAVYLQNSGEGNIINPVASLLNEKVYGIPCLFIVGWRGEPGKKDEPQHIFQGEITAELLDVLHIKYYIVDESTGLDDLEKEMVKLRHLLDSGKQVALIIKKNALEYDQKIVYTNDNSMVREEVIQHIVAVSEDDPIVSTTGKASRELFEIREANGSSHGYDFLTVGSMGHSSSIALGIALNKSQKKIWCIDGDGAMLMHMGALAVIGSYNPTNFVHIVINNGAHETVGGMPTVAKTIDIQKMAIACGYKNAVSVNDYGELDVQLKRAKDCDELTLIEVRCSIGSRYDLGRPTSSPQENKVKFIYNLYK